MFALKHTEDLQQTPGLVEELSGFYARLTSFLLTAHHENGTQFGATLPIGSVSLWAGGTAPSGWLLCNGGTASRTTYRDLFLVVGTTFGVGNGSTTFTLPSISAVVSNVVYIIYTGV